MVKILFVRSFDRSIDRIDRSIDRPTDRSIDRSFDRSRFGRPWTFFSLYDGRASPQGNFFHSFISIRVHFFFFKTNFFQKFLRPPPPREGPRRSRVTSPGAPDAAAAAKIEKKNGRPDVQTSGRPDVRTSGRPDVPTSNLDRDLRVTA